MDKYVRQLKSAIIVQAKQHANNDQRVSVENAAATRARAGHEGYCPGPLIDEPRAAVGAEPEVAGAVGACVKSICPVIGDKAEARRIAPTTIRMMGYVLPKSKAPPRI